MTSFGTQSRASNRRQGSGPLTENPDDAGHPESRGIAAPATGSEPTSPTAEADDASAGGTLRACGYERWGKRALSLVLLAVALPIGVAAGLPIAAVNLLLFRDPRRILFRQIRIGHRGREFAIWKFRTMRDETPEGEFQSWQKGTDTSRVTRFGRFLRSTHLDELPQLINIVAGDMDFIGPRPEMRRVHRWASELIPRFHERTSMRPGITGLAQVTQGYVGCDEQAYRVKLASDLEYGRRMSLKLDLQILLRTVTWMLMGRGWNQIEVEGTDLLPGAAEARMGECPEPTHPAPLTPKTQEAGAHTEILPRAQRSTAAERPLPSPQAGLTIPATSPASRVTNASSSTTPALGTPNAQAD